MRNMPSQASTAVSDEVTLASPRCQFSFADGRRCRMPSAPPVLCPAHAKTESQPSSQSPATDLAPLAGEFRTATEVNSALGKVFLLLAQNRIPRRNAVALGYIAQLLLQTLPRVKEEFIAGLGYQAWQETLDSALQEDSEDDETEPAAEADATHEPEAEAGEVREVAVAVPLGTPISALASFGPPERNPITPVAKTDERSPHKPAVARVFSESALADSEGPAAVAVPLGTPISALASCSPGVMAPGSSESVEGITQEQESEQSPEPDADCAAWSFVSWRQKVGPGWVYWNNPEVIEQLDNMEAMHRLRMRE